MFCYVMQWKIPIECSSLYMAHDVIISEQVREAGDIVNGHWVIINDGTGIDCEEYHIGDYAHIVNLKLVDIFATDVEYTNFKKINTEHQMFNNKLIKLNIYETQ